MTLGLYVFTKNRSLLHTQWNFLFKQKKTMSIFIRKHDNLFKITEHFKD